MEDACLSGAFPLTTPIEPRVCPSRTSAERHKSPDEINAPRHSIQTADAISSADLPGQMHKRLIDATGQSGS